MSSSKSNSHIVETNASGIVTIVIDDDYCRPIDDNSFDPNSSDHYFMSSPTARRPAIGVRTPVPPPGSPKFINSDNCQNILIKENKTNVIVVNSGGSGDLRSTLFRPGHTFSPSSSCCSTQSFAPDVEPKHNIVSKHQTHYIVVNKPKPMASSPALTSSSLTSTPSSPSLTSKSSPTKLRLWTQSANQSTPRSPQVIVSTRSRSHTSLPPEDVESDCMDDKTFFKYLNLIHSNDHKNKSKLSLLTSWPLRKVSKIPKPTLNRDGALVLPNFKSIAEPIRLVVDITRQLAERKLQWYRGAQQYNKRLQIFRANLPTNTQIRERLQTELEGIHKLLMNEKQDFSLKEEKYRRMKTAEQNQILQRQELRQEMDSYNNSFEMSSLMGRRVMSSICNDIISLLNAVDILKLNTKIEMFCKSMDILAINVPQNTKHSTRITRSNTGFAGIDKMWGPRSEAHEYCFTRKQRLERYKRLDTGLNWKSRLVKKHCRPIDVEVAKITRCPCCLELVEPEWGHSCRDSDEESLPEEISSFNDSEYGVQSEVTLNDELVSTASELITTGTAVCFECGEEDCNGFCVSLPETTVTHISNKDNSVAVKPKSFEIDDKIMVNKIPVLHDKSNNNIINNKNIRRKQNPEHNIRLNNDKIVQELNDSEDDIVIISEVRDIRDQSQPKCTPEPVMITRFRAKNLETKPSIKRKFCDKTLRSHSHNSSDEIIVKKIK